MARSDKGTDAGQAEVQSKVDEETEQGYRGTKVDPRPDTAYSVASGPDSPSAVPDDRSRLDQTHALPKEG